MAAKSAMFLFEVVVDNVQSYVESRHLVIRSEFADIFSLELKDPKHMHIVIPEPPPLPPEPAGKKGKKAKPKPKPKKGKKGKVEAPPPEPSIQSGQSVLFSSTAEFLIQNMKKCPMELSLWSKEDALVYIGSTPVNWDPMFYTYLGKICNCEAPVPVTLKEEYNIFQEGKAKIMAKVGIQIKLTYLGEKVTTEFRTLSEDPTVKKVLYTGINSKTTSYVCTMKTTDEDFEENCNKIPNNYIVDKPRPVVYASYKNAPAANLTFFNEGDYCCMKHADKPPDSIYKSPECCPDIDFIVDYVRKIIVSCNDNMRMLTPRPTIHPRKKATDIDRLCYCKETEWPEGKIAERFKKVVNNEPCPLCAKDNKNATPVPPKVFDIANIRGPCGKADCRIARDIRSYIENLVDEDNVELNINEVIGPCGSKECTVAEKIQDFLRHEGAFINSATKEGLSTQCDCIQKMKEAMTEKSSCTSICSKECDTSDSTASKCGGKGCPFIQKVYNVYYFNVEYDFDVDSGESSKSPSVKSSKYKHCSLDTCPNLQPPKTCSKTVCTPILDPDQDKEVKCLMPVCPDRKSCPPSPADSNIVIALEDIHRPCCVKTCEIADKVKDIIVDGVLSKREKKTVEDDPCYCDCVCSFKFTKNTTYCAVCGGYECLGDDMANAPEYAKPHPCPVYHKLYDKTFIRVQSPWPDDDKQDNFSTKSSKSANKGGTAPVERNPSRTKSTKSVPERRSDKKESPEEKKKEKEGKKQKPPKQEKNPVGKFTTVVEEKPLVQIEKKPETKYPYPAVPKSMGWNWVAEDIPGLKPRPKWRPGAANKILVRRYRALREGVDTIAKKKRAMLQRKKKIEMKPTLVISKKDGEYTVQMEVFKKYSKERLLFQYPYDDTKPPLTYTIGKTAEERRKIQRQRERRERRETRRKSRLLQSTFKDKCQEICLKAYNQAIGLLPLPKPNSPDCPCRTKSVDIVTPPIDSCSCSEEGTISSSDTDHDEWVIEFTPPVARWDAKAKHPPTYADNETQYTYLDYRVKLLDKSGNQVVRYFKGPDGKQECTDLGGFWGPGHVWLEINKDGFIGPDNRWIPLNFIGPDGMCYTSEEGAFTDNTGQRYKIGVDGYIDKDTKWVWYHRPRRPVASSAEVPKKGYMAPKSSPTEVKGKNFQNKDKATGPENKGKRNVIKGGRTAEMKKTVSYTARKAKNPVVMNVFLKNNEQYYPSNPQTKSMKQIDPRTFAKYREIMNDLQMYEDLGELKIPTKANRASNTPRKKVSPFTIYGLRNLDRNANKIATKKSFANESSTSSKTGTESR